MKSKSNIRHIKVVLIIIALSQCSLLMTGCKKYITIDTSPTSVGTETAFMDDPSAIQVVTSLYNFISTRTANGNYLSTTTLTELYADNLSLLNKTQSPYGDYYTNNLEPEYLNAGGGGNTFWAVYYNQLYTVNTAIEQLKENKNLSPAVANRLLGEAYFLRGFYYFYLVNIYGEVPLVLSTEYEKTGKLAKSSAPAVYAQIEADLSAAEPLLNQTYVAANLVASTPDRIRPNLGAVQALKARVLLYDKKYAEAEQAATSVINQSAYVLNDPAVAFLKNSTETIWSIPSVRTGYNTYEGSIFTLPAAGPNNSFPFYASTSLVNSFTPGDARKTVWLGKVTTTLRDYYYPAKYKIPFVSQSKDFRENEIILRLPEVYLIRAEARNEQGKTADAIADLNTLRAKRRTAATIDVPDPLPALTTTLTQSQLRTSILNERRVELFTEGGHRLFDLRRSGTVDQVMTEENKEKGGTWASYKAYSPIPRFDLTANPNLKQTPGYPN